MEGEKWQCSHLPKYHRDINDTALESVWNADCDEDTFISLYPICRRIRGRNPKIIKKKTGFFHTSSGSKQYWQLLYAKKWDNIFLECYRDPLLLIYFGEVQAMFLRVRIDSLTTSLFQWTKLLIFMNMFSRLNSLSSWTKSVNKHFVIYRNLNLGSENIEISVRNTWYFVFLLLRICTWIIKCESTFYLPI